MRVLQLLMMTNNAVSYQDSDSFRYKFIPESLVVFFKMELMDMDDLIDSSKDEAPATRTYDR